MAWWSRRTKSASLIGGAEERPAVDASSRSWRDEIHRITEICERAGSGDLEARVAGLHADPELAALGRAVNHMLDIADSFVREASAAMSEASCDRFHRPILLRGLAGAYRQSAVVINRAGLRLAHGAEQFTHIANLATETAANVSTVAAACEELNATSSEIARRSAESVSLTELAVKEAGQATTAIAEFSEAARQIGEVVVFIGKVAAQTNLLALNATIEAQRAGSSGQGFAVVAGEVKELARSTARATDQIGRQVDRIQSAVDSVVSHIHGINSSIHRIDEDTAEIARSVDDQVKATADIGANIVQVSGNMQQVSQRIADFSTDRRAMEAVSH